MHLHAHPTLITDYHHAQLEGLRRAAGASRLRLEAREWRRQRRRHGAAAGSRPPV